MKCRGSGPGLLPDLTEKLSKKFRHPAVIPQSPASNDELLEQVIRVPFGARSLRITVFPLLCGGEIPAPGLKPSLIPTAAMPRTPFSPMASPLPRAVKGSRV